MQIAALYCKDLLRAAETFEGKLLNCPPKLRHAAFFLQLWSARNIYLVHAEGEMHTLEVLQVAEGSTADRVWELTWQSLHCLSFPRDEWAPRTFSALYLCSDARPQWASCWYCTFAGSFLLWMLNEAVKVRYAEHALPRGILFSRCSSSVFKWRFFGLFSIAIS